jgi:RNA polymerase sigma-70 factor (ECF subfamily)
VRRLAFSLRRTQASASPPFDELVLPHLDGAYNLARFLTRDPALSEDIVQDAMLRAFRSFDQFRGDSPRAWLFAIVRNCCRTALTAQSASALRLVREAENGVAAEQKADTRDDPEQSLMRASDAAMVRAEIEGLAEPFREALVLRDLEELSYKEIAQITGVAMGTVMSRIARARALLADRLTGRSAAAEDETRSSR